MDVTFWPAGDGAPWSWDWRAYPGVWLLLATVTAAFVLARRRADPPQASLEARASRRQLACFIAGLLVLWLALDWPLGALAAGSLLSAAALQYLLVTLAAVPLLLLGFPRARIEDGAPSRAALSAWRPPPVLLGGATFAAVLFATSLPALVDALRPSALGSMLLMLSWLAAAVVLWWPLLRWRPPLGYMAGIAYLFVPFLLPKIPGLVHLVADGPLYEVYAQAPRVPGLALTAGADQRAAGALLWSAGTAMIFVSLGVLFFHWYREERRAAVPGSLRLPADPEVVNALFSIPGGWTALERMIVTLEAAVPVERAGTELRFALHPNPRGVRVVVEVHAVLDRASTVVIEAGVAHALARHLATIRPEHRAALEERFAIEVVPIHARTT